MRNHFRESPPISSGTIDGKKNATWQACTRYFPQGSMWECACLHKTHIISKDGDTTSPLCFNAGARFAKSMTRHWNKLLDAGSRHTYVWKASKGCWCSNDLWLAIAFIENLIAKTCMCSKRKDRTLLRLCTTYLPMFKYMGASNEVVIFSWKDAAQK